MNAVNGLPNVQIVVPGLRDMGTNPAVPAAAARAMMPPVQVVDSNASFFVPSKSNGARNNQQAPQQQQQQQNFVMENPVGSPVPRPPQQARAYGANNRSRVQGVRSPSERAYDESFYAQSPPAPSSASRTSPYR